MATAKWQVWLSGLLDWRAFWSSFREVLYLTVFALLPLLFNILINWFTSKSLSHALETKIIPGEILAYCLSFLAPSMYLQTKTQGTGYKLPFLHAFSITTLLIYGTMTVLYVVAKNKWVPGINMDQHDVDPFYIMAVSFFVVTIIFRIYSVYHGKGVSNFQKARTEQQKNFNTGFSESIKE